MTTAPSVPELPKIKAGTSAILARRYADALYELAETAGQLDAVLVELRGLKQLQHENTEFQQAVNHPRLSRLVLQSAMAAVAKSANLSPLTSQFLGVLAQNRRLSSLPDIADAYALRLASARGEFTAEIQSATALSQTQQDQLTQQLQALAGGKVRLVINLVPALLGGLIIKLGSRRIDASLRGKLARLEQELKTLAA